MKNLQVLTGRRVNMNSMYISIWGWIGMKGSEYSNYTSLKHKCILLF